MTDMAVPVHGYADDLGPRVAEMAAYNNVVIEGQAVIIGVDTLADIGVVRGLGELSSLRAVDLNWRQLDYARAEGMLRDDETYYGGFESWLDEYGPADVAFALSLRRESVTTGFTRRLAQCVRKGGGIIVTSSFDAEAGKRLQSGVMLGGVVLANLEQPPAELTIPLQRDSRQNLMMWERMV
jgi:hypothetical protein